jgi:hypothetical protein
VGVHVCNFYGKRYSNDAELESILVAKTIKILCLAGEMEPHVPHC